MLVDPADPRWSSTRPGCRPRTVRRRCSTPWPASCAQLAGRPAGCRWASAWAWASPGWSTAAGVLRVGPNLPGLRDVQVGGELDRRLGLPIRVDNDATCAAWGEHLAGAARGGDDAVCVTLGTGIGAGIVADGELVRGAHGFGGEAGHMVVDPDGPPCPCGRRGCWERFASGSGLGRLGREAAEAGRFPRARRAGRGRGGACGASTSPTRPQRATPTALAVLADVRRVGGPRPRQPGDPARLLAGGDRRRRWSRRATCCSSRCARPYPAQVMAAAERPDVRIVAAELGERAGAIGAALLGGREALVPAGVEGSGIGRPWRRGGARQASISAIAAAAALPAPHAGVLVGLEHLVDLEEVLDLVDEVGRQVGHVLDLRPSGGRRRARTGSWRRDRRRPPSRTRRRAGR